MTYLIEERNFDAIGSAFFAAGPIVPSRDLGWLESRVRVTLDSLVSRLENGNLNADETRRYGLVMKNLEFAYQRFLRSNNETEPYWRRVVLRQIKCIRPSYGRRDLGRSA